MLGCAVLVCLNMRVLYSTIFYLLLPFILLRLLWKSKAQPMYRQRIAERFMWKKQEVSKVDIWIHAVSLGEVNAALGLIEACLSKGYKLLITTMTPTGSQRVKACFGNRVIHQYIPYDLPFAMRRFYKSYQPKLGIIMETELWPNMLAEGKWAKIPLLLVNARISPSAFKAYQRIQSVLRPYLNCFVAILTQNAAETQRFLQLRADKARVMAIGNLKFDIPPYIKNETLSHTWRRQVGLSRMIVCAASTHEDEERELLRSFREFQHIFPLALLVLVPRHPERFYKVFELCNANAFRTVLRSEMNMVDSTVEVVVVNSIGELNFFYAISDYAFVGGSLVPVGGHNVLEPINVGTPVFCGPHIQNFQVICDALVAVSGIQIIANAEALFLAIRALHNNPELKNQQVVAAKNILLSNQGAARRCMEKIENLIRTYDKREDRGKN